MLPFFIAAVLGLIAWQIAEAERPTRHSPVWRRRVTIQAETRLSGLWRPAGRWVSTAGPKRVTPHASGTEARPARPA